MEFFSKPFKTPQNSFFLEHLRKTAPVKYNMGMMVCFLLLTQVPSCASLGGLGLELKLKFPSVSLGHGTKIRTGITCKKIPCCMRDTVCRWFIVKKAKIF